MKSLRSVGLAVVFAFVAAAATPLSAQSPKWRHLQGGGLAGAHFIDDQTGWVSGDSRIHWTDDGGDTWNEATFEDAETNIEIRVPLRGMFFLDTDTGFCVGDGGVVLKSVSGFDGQHWEDINPNSRILDACGQPARLYSIFMVDEDIGFVVGDDGAIAKTTNGGLGWTNIGEDVDAVFECGEDPHDAYDVWFFADSGEGFEAYDKGIIAADYSRVYTTDDAGATWSEVYIYGEIIDASGTVCPAPHHGIDLWSLGFDDPLDASSPGWVAGGVEGARGYVFRTSSGGTTGTWSQIQCFDFINPQGSPMPTSLCGTSTLYAFSVLDGDASPVRAMSAGYGGELYVYETGTTNFNPCDCDDQAPFACGSNAPTFVQKSTQLPVAGPMTDETPLFASARISDSSGCAVGPFGRIVKYVQSGSPEIEDIGGTYFVRLQDGDFRNASDGCVTGQGYTVMRTEDGGTTWSVPEKDWSENGNAQGLGLDFSSSGDHGVVVGSGGFIAITNGTTDPEESWTEDVTKPSGTLPDLTAVAFVPGEDTVYAVASSGSVLKSTDNGESWDWTASSPSGASALYGVSFATPSVGYVAGAGAGVWKTTDGGANWSAVPTLGAGSEAFRDVETWGDGSAGVIVAEGGAVYEKTPTGARFNKLTLGSLSVTANLNDVQAIIDGSYVNLRICGEQGVTLFRDYGTWTEPRSGTTLPLSRMVFLSADEGYAIGLTFIIMKYDDE
jgi:photosystem II stability/assembly factor-like uncharacterized protein